MAERSVDQDEIRYTVGNAGEKRESKEGWRPSPGRNTPQNEVRLMTHNGTSTDSTTLVVSFSPTDSRIAEALAAPSYRAYLRRTRRGNVTVGDEWEEFVSGGCGTTHEVSLRVESVTGGTSIDDETEFVFEPRSDDD